MKRIGLMLVVLLTAALIFSGCSVFKTPQTLPPARGEENGTQSGESPEIKPEPAADEKKVTLYFGDFQAQHVIPEERTVKLTGSKTLPEVVMEELLAGPEDPYLKRTLPDTTRLLSIEVTDGIAYVNLTRTRVPGSAGEAMATRSIVYSLTELPGVEKVQILMEGKKSESFGGHQVFEEPIDRGPILTFPIFIDEERVKWLQERVDRGEETWRTDPVEVARRDGRMAGFTLENEYEVVAREEGIIVVETEAAGRTYHLELHQPVKKGDVGIWVITSVDQVK